MKKLILLVVLALSACATMNAQDRIQRMFNQIDRVMYTMDMIDRDIQMIKSRFGRQRVTTQKDFRLGTIYMYRENNAYIKTRDLEIEIGTDFVRVSGSASRYMSRQDYSGNIIINNVALNNGYATLQIRNNNIHTIVSFYSPGTHHIIKAFHVNHGQQPQRRRYPYYVPNRYR